MPVAREYRAKIELPVEWGWQFLHDLEDLLTSKGFASRFAEWTASDGRVNASSTREMASELPDPLSHTNFLFTMTNGEPFSGETSVTFSSWSRVEGKPTSVSIRISGNDETEVLGLREVLQKFADRWELHEDEPSKSSNDIQVAETDLQVAEMNPKIPWWQTNWVWGAIGAGLVLLGIIVTIIVS